MNSLLRQVVSQKEKAATLRSPPFQPSVSILASWVELPAAIFAPRFSCVLWELRGFARFQGLDRNFGLSGQLLSFTANGNPPFRDAKG
jgi:hypothetical protein